MRSVISKTIVVLLLGSLLAVSGFFTVSQAEAQTAGNKTRITYWSIYPSTDPYTPKHQEYVDKFTAENQDIEIVHQGTNFWDYFTKLKTAQAGGDTVDVYWQDIVSVKFRAKNNVAANLSPFIQRYKVDMSQWTENDIDTVSYGKGIYAMIFSSDSRIMYYNKDHFIAAGLDPDSPPSTFEKLKEYAEKLTIYETAEKKRLLQVGFHPRLGNNAIQQIVWPMGGTFFDDEGNPTVNMAENIAAVQWWIDIARNYPLRAMNAFTSEHSEGTGKDQSFIQGATSIIIDGDWLAWQIEKYNPDLNYGVAAVPYSAEEYRSNWSGGFTLEMSAQTTGDTADAAWRFISYMTGKEVQTDMISKLDFLPANTKAIEELSKTASENQKLVFAEFPFRRHVDYCEAAPEWWNFVQEQLSKAESGEISAETAMNTAQEKLKAVIDEYDITNQGTEIPVVPILVGAGVFVVVLVLVIVLGRKAKKGKESK